MPANEEDNDYIDLQQYLLVIKRRWLATTLVVGSVSSLTGLITFSQKPVYEAQGKLLLKQESGASSLTGLSQKVGELSGLTNTSNPIETEAEVIRSNPLIEKTINKFQLQDKQGQPLEIDAFFSNLKVKGVRGTDVMEISYKSTDQEQAAAIVNYLMDAYLENNIQVNRADVTAAKQFLRKQLPQIEARVVRAEAALRRFKDANQVVSLQEEAKVGVEALKDFTEEITKAQAQLAGTKSRSQGLQSQLQLTRQQAVSLTSLSQSPGVQQVLTEYQKVQDDLAVAKTRLTEEHPTVRNLANKGLALKQQLEKRVVNIVDSPESIPEKNLQIGELKQTITEELVKSEVERLALEQQVGVLQKTFLSYHARMKALPRLEQLQRALERKLQVAQSTYQQVLKQLQEVEVVEQQQLGNARTISPALVPQKPISPKIKLNLALGGFLGVLLGIGTALLLEAMDKSLKNVEEAKRLLGVPLLGSIPRVGDKGKKKLEEGHEELPVLNSPYSPVNTAFEMLRTNLSFTVSDKELRIIAVTSSCPNEGKSFVSANLAVAISQLGKRVLLIDADMRRPRQQKIWQLTNLSGLSNVLVNQAQLSNTVQEALVTLDVLTVGKIPPNPVTILDSQRMGTVIEEATNDYDFVIIDTPSLTAVADALVVAKFVDGMLMVVRPGEVDSGAVTTAKSVLEQAKVNVLGMVVNGVSGDHGYGGYYYSKGYYGNRESKEGVGIQVG
ncbi:MAG: polysaccharide biosynthesis tyrosine autokinase [Calothrix sp. MO_167.B42]|nr:polysaccharide biosynthesis tyrosine autokinase [Calothrix sp. MO_167.B42]